MSRGAWLNGSPSLVRVGPAPTIALEVRGTGPFVLFLHGIGGSRRQWQPQLTALSDTFRVAAWDARGYGDSDDYAGPLQFSVFVDDVLRVLDHFGVARASIVGLSMGGRIAREVALRAPDRVDRLVLANTTPGFSSLSADEQRRFVESRAAPIRAGAPVATIAREMAPRLLHRDADAATIEAVIAMMSALHPESYIKTVEASVAQDRAAPIESIRAPTLVITSDADPLYPRAISEDMARRIPGARLVVIERAGHLSNIERPLAFNRALRDFLAPGPEQAA